MKLLEDNVPYCKLNLWNLLTDSKVQRGILKMLEKHCISLKEKERLWEEFLGPFACDC